MRYSNELQSEDPHSARNALLAGAVVTFMVVAVLIALNVGPGDQRRAVLLIAGPLVLVGASLISRNPALIIATIATCFLVGIVSIFSIGLPLIALSICLLAWFVFRTHQDDRRLEWTDVVVANLIVFSELVVFGVVVFA